MKKYRFVKDYKIEIDAIANSYDGNSLYIDILSLLEQGYIEEVQEPWATDKDCIELIQFAIKQHSTVAFTIILQQFKKERGK